MIRASIVSLSALSGVASASTVNFVAQDLSAGRLAGVNTSAILSADDSTFTITLRNQTESGSMTAFYIESGSALTGLGTATIVNGAGVHFTQGGTAAGHQSGSTASASGVFAPNGMTGFVSVAPGSTALAGGFGPDWSGSFFSMNGRGELGQANGEFVSVTFSHDGSFSLDNLLASLANDDVRFVQLYDGFGDEDARGFLNSALVVVPLPPAAWAGLGMLGVVAAARAFKKHRQA